ncbi:hypothetical protein ACFYP4_02430 [Streptomyces sp. NPDC005551]|uniref:hypothetical protein n=1 Tax=Streptomyces sp. NPDC005551 TaxID=3364725 RepID=UPI00368AE920
MRELSTCKAVTKARAALSAQELHVADIDRVRECRACGSDNKSTVCKPRRASRIERTEATQSRIAVLAASKRDDTLADPNLITRWTKAQEKSWA